MNHFCIKILLLLCNALLYQAANAQLNIINAVTPADLAKVLGGEGVKISNVYYVGDPKMAGFFYNTGGTNLNIDSGIVLTTGLARTERAGKIGINGNGTVTAQLIDADNSWAMTGDNDLALAIGAPLSDLYDACVLEFDFVPLGDSIRFNYVFSSEEYTPNFVCQFNDAFAFFISGPGISGLKNIALVPNTTVPVSIFNVNDVPGGACPNNAMYYSDNVSNTYLTHDGHTTVLTAQEKVQPCKTYHLKLVIADVMDDMYDSGVFLQAKSLSSNAATITANTSTDLLSGEQYLVEGCAPGNFLVQRDRIATGPMDVSLAYAGTAINGTDVQLLPLTVTIPGGSSSTMVNLIPVMDGLPEGNELLKIYTLTGCDASIPSDSVLISFRDYAPLALSPDTATICKGNTLQLTAPSGYDSYSWNNVTTLDNGTLQAPLALPVKVYTTYSCIANIAGCYYLDSVVAQWKQPFIKLFAGNDTVAVINEPIQLYATDMNNAGIVQYIWTPGNFLNDPSRPDPEATLQQDYRYVVKGITADGCEAKDDIFIKVYKGPEIYVPSGFTPNNDGLNDRLTILPVGIKAFHFFRVFNRWGQLVFSTSDPRKSWDGIINGIIQPPGSYVWMTEAVDYKGNLVSRKGIVTIIR